MQIRFLLGPAGSGKTFRCLAEIREELLSSPDGSPLILLAPKQATFQLERQLLGRGEPKPMPEGGSRGLSPHPESGDGLAGYTRLRILSFERLAEFVFEQLGRPVPELLAEEGRVMVLRALLEQRRGELRLFRASARLPGFSRQLSRLLRELQQHRFTPARLETLADTVEDTSHLRAKLRDLALLQRGYEEWLKQHQLEDADRLLDLAADALRSGQPVSSVEFRISSLWLDGFAQMTPQERGLLAELARWSEGITLAFCLEGEPREPLPWHSPWAAVTETFLRCREELGAVPGAELKIERLDRDLARSRFRDQPSLQLLERLWEKPDEPAAGGGISAPGIRVVAGATPEAEAELAAREIRRYVRERNGRYRDAAVLVRSLDLYHDAIRRAFQRYDVPFFLDRRESVAHHPLAELTRCALRVVTYGWEHDDWFGALKTGLVHDDDVLLDRLENEALARGWRGKAIWLEPASAAGAGPGEWLEKLDIVPPFRRLSDSLSARQRCPTGAQLGAALREFWNELKVDRKLERWSALALENAGPATTPGPVSPAPAIDRNRQSQIHQAVWEQMTGWLRNLELAFSGEALPLNEWLPVLEAGLANLTVGVVPPALDQVLVGAIDRSRNPDLQLAFLLGLNEGVFPAPPPPPALLNRSDREALAAHRLALGPDHHQQIGLERYYGYIACTRARDRLVLTWAQRDADGRTLNPSPFVGEIRRRFPGLAEETFAGVEDWRNAEHWSELVLPLLRNPAPAVRSALLSAAPMLEPVAAKWEQVAALRQEDRVPAALVEKLHGLELRTSVSALEDFAACPFKFFAGRSLRAEERLEFEIDAREKGSFQHEALKEFHLRLRQAGRRWRDLTPAEGRALMREVGASLAPVFRDGLFAASPARRFAAQLLIEGLERLVETLIGWARQYQFDPAAVETSFGLQESRLPAWRIDLDARHALLLRGRIDRIDLCRVAGSSEALAVVIDYKSSARQLDPVLLHHGLELQLLAYLGALSHLDHLEEALEVSRIIPAGAFFVALKGWGGSAATRNEERNGREESRRAGSQHRGRFDGGYLDRFDARDRPKGDQFKYAKNKDGSFSLRGNEALPSDEFQALLARVEEFLRQHGRDIYAGRTEVSPYRWRNETACDLCRYRAICRFDPWTQPYRVLRPPPKHP